MKKTLSDLTIKEFLRYQELVSDKIVDPFEIMELFGYEPETMDVPTFNKTQQLIINYQLKKVDIKKVYKIGNRKYTCLLNLTKMKAAQFIDFQNYLSQGYKIEQVLSIFLIPIKRNKFGIRVNRDYGDGYDVNEEMEYILNNMKFEVAKSLADFFLSQSKILLTSMKGFLNKKKWMEMKKLNNLRKKVLRF